MGPSLGKGWMDGVAAGALGPSVPGPTTHPPCPAPLARTHAQFEVMMQSKQIKEFRCFFEPKSNKFHSVVQLGM